MRIDREQWEREIALHDALFERLGERRPEALVDERERLFRNLSM
jgi:GTP-dependent phosphoenolpyruvate carboxykinase